MLLKRVYITAVEVIVDAVNVFCCYLSVFNHFILSAKITMWCLAESSGDVIQVLAVEKFWLFKKDAF